MVIFKRLSLIALIALQDLERGGGQGNKNNDTNSYLRLYIIIHQYIDAQSHLLHTHSLPVSLSPSHPHTHTHTPPPHTHTYTEQIRQIRANQILGG